MPVSILCMSGIASPRYRTYEYKICASKFAPDWRIEADPDTPKITDLAFSLRDTIYLHKNAPKQGDMGEPVPWSRKRNMRNRPRRNPWRPYLAPARAQESVTPLRQQRHSLSEINSCRII
ncbi:hypothetical protein JOE11_001793 [Robbsia andropogonis]